MVNENGSLGWQQNPGNFSTNHATSQDSHSIGLSVSF